MKTIVVTGGPCSGKTTALEELRRHAAAGGLTAVFVDEAGTDLILQGITPQSCGSMRAFQTRVTALQLEREAAARAQAASLGESAVVICDRGVCDGAAYLDEHDYQEVLDDHGLTHAQALGRYDAVVFMDSVAAFDPESYTLANNSARSETVEEAARLNARTAAAWADHPHFHRIAAQESFDAKVDRCYSTLRTLAYDGGRIPVV